MALIGSLSPTVAVAAPNAASLAIVWQSADDPTVDDSAYPATVLPGAVLFDSLTRPAEIRTLTPAPAEAIVLTQVEGTGKALAPGKDGWFVAGSVDRFYPLELLDFDSPRRDLALAKVGLDGHADWQTEWGGPGFQVATGVLALSNGGALVHGRDGEADVLWAVDDAGRTLWTKHLGLEVCGTASLPGGNIAVLALDGDATTHPKTELALWLLDDNGRVTSRTVVRPTLGTRPYSGTLKASLVVVDGAIVVASDWDTYPGVDMPPFEVARFDFSGTPQWVVRPPAERCFGALYASQDGNLLTTCEERPTAGQTPHFALVRLNAADGSATVLRAPLPHCEVDRYWAHVSVAGTLGGQPLVIGVQPKADTGRYCMWVARVETSRP